MAYIVNDLLHDECPERGVLKVERKKYGSRSRIYFGGLVVIVLLFLTVKKESQSADIPLSERIKQMLVTEAAWAVSEDYLPILSFAGEQNREITGARQFRNFMPIYAYAATAYDDKHPEESAGQIILSLDNMEVPLEESNTAVGTEQTGESLQELLRAENEAAQVMNGQSAFTPHGLQNMVDINALADYETLVSTFYTIDGNTMAGQEQLNVSALMSHDMRIAKESSQPQILIYHTHSQEAFSDSVPGDVSTSIVGVGTRLSEILTNTYGYNVLHHTGQYDVDTRDDAYANSLPALEQLLVENPSIEVVIDLHRDSMPEETKLVMDMDGRPTARFMFFNGLSRTKNTGDIAYLHNKYQEENLAFSFQMQLKAAQYYPGLTRKIYLKGYRYNMHLCPRTTLIELGAQNNTVEEAMNACDPLAHIIHMVLSGEE